MTERQIAADRCTSRNPAATQPPPGATVRLKGPGPAIDWAVCLSAVPRIRYSSTAAPSSRSKSHTREARGSSVSARSTAADARALLARVDGT